MNRLQDALAKLDERLNHTEDARAKARGWKTHKTGLLGLSRSYSDPRWAARKAIAEAELDDALAELDTSVRHAA